MSASSGFSDPKKGLTFSRMEPNNWKVNNQAYSWSPPTDIYEANNNFIVKIEIAGMKQSDITINIEDKILTVVGTRKEINEHRSYHQIEIRFGDFRSAVELPDGLNLDKTNAEYEDGFLMITIPIIKPKKIKIQEK